MSDGLILTPDLCEAIDGSEDGRPIAHGAGLDAVALAALGAMIALAVLSINFIGDGLRNALDPDLMNR